MQCIGKIGLSFAISDRVTCTNTFSNNSDGWRPVMQACFLLKIQHISQSGPLVTWFLRNTAKQKNSLNRQKVHIVTAFLKFLTGDI